MYPIPSLCYVNIIQLISKLSINLEKNILEIGCSKTADSARSVLVINLVECNMKIVNLAN